MTSANPRCLRQPTNDIKRLRLDLGDQDHILGLDSEVIHATWREFFGFSVRSDSWGDFFGVLPARMRNPHSTAGWLSPASEQGRILHQASKHES